MKRRFYDEKQWIINLTLLSLISRSRGDIVNAIRILPHSCALYF